MRMMSQYHIINFKLLKIPQLQQNTRKFIDAFRKGRGDYTPLFLLFNFFPKTSQRKIILLFKNFRKEKKKKQN